jgi:homoaconitase/3-isopropylmalate dehydratase large subunit
MTLNNSPKTLYDKIWNSHLVDNDGSSQIIYVDRQLIHEVTSPQAFEGLRIAGRKPRRPEAHLAVADHNVPTTTADRAVLTLAPNMVVNSLFDKCWQMKAEVKEHFWDHAFHDFSLWLMPLGSNVSCFAY